MLGRLFWTLAFLVGLLWPARLIGRLDGLPLDRPLEALLVGILLPTLWILNPRFLRTRFAKGGILVLLGWKIASAGLLHQGGWCATFSTYHPSRESYHPNPSWDLRRDAGHSSQPCSAIAARPYDFLTDFPAWSINIPFQDTLTWGGDSLSIKIDSTRPPDGRYRLTLAGALLPARAGELSFELGQDVQFNGALDGRPLPAQRDGRVTVPLDAGEHTIFVSLDLTGDDWRLVPRWNGQNLFKAVPTGLGPGRVTAGLVARWGSGVPALLILVLLGAWVIATARELRPTAGVSAWCIGSVLTVGFLAVGGHDNALRAGLLALAVAAFIPVPPRLQDWKGALLLFGAPWLSLYAVRSLGAIGSFTVFSSGDDWLRFQRFAHRIFMEHYWLEGGEPAFYFQPLYRWMTGVLHLLFGDSSVGDLYWDVFGLLIGAILAFQVAKRFAGFRAGVVAGAMVLATMAIGPNWHWIGKGLSEISASAWLCLAALSLFKARGGSLRYAVLGGVFAVLAFYTRLNHLPLVLALVVFTLPDDLPAGALWQGRLLWQRLPKPVASTYLACLALGVLLFAVRTWYYTGQLSVFGGTQLSLLGTGLGRTVQSFWSPEVWKKALESVLSIVVVRDPPRFDPRSVLVVLGVCCAMLGLLRFPGLRRLPFHLAMVCIGAIAGGLVVRGTAYSGRFSIHLIPFAVTVSICAAVLLGEWFVVRSRAPARTGSLPAR